MNDFPYTVEDEPTENWTVEHVLQWWLLRANAESEAEYNSIVKGLSEQLEEGKKAVWEAHEQVSEIVRESENETKDNENGNENRNDIHNENKNTTENTENQSVHSNQQPLNNSNSNNNNNKTNNIYSYIKRQPQIEKPASKTATATSTRAARSKKPTEKAAATVTDDVVVVSNSSKSEAVTNGDDVVVVSNTSKSENKKPDTIHIDVIEGPYEGKFYDLQPKTRSHAWLGRSSSAKFKDRGISLPLDLEVSTSHGRFEYRQGKFYYTDVASTNGTRINGEDCIPNQPYELKEDEQTILVGQTAMKVTLLKLA